MNNRNLISKAIIPDYVQLNNIKTIKAIKQNSFYDLSTFNQSLRNYDVKLGQHVETVKKVINSYIN